MTTEQSLVCIVDDDPSLRDALRSLLRSVGHAVRDYGSTQAFVAGARPDLPACLVLDVRLPGRSGLEFMTELAGHGIRLPVVFITGHGDIPMSVSAMKAGAIEFLTKPFRDQDLLDAVHRGIEIDRQRRIEAAALAGLQARYSRLTPREREVMGRVTAGLLNKQIAGELHLSEITVKIHRAQAMRKMEAGSLADLVRMADRLAGDAAASGAG